MTLGGGTAIALAGGRSAPPPKPLDQGRLDLQTGAGPVNAVWDSTTLSVYVPL
jgi:hypothetical protein